MESREEYITNHAHEKISINPEWSEPKYTCPKCDGNVRKNLVTVFTSYPPKYLYRCDECDYEEYMEI